MQKEKDNSLPWSPAEYEARHAEAFQALARGDCPEHQQKEILRWIIEDLTDAYGLSFRPDDLGGDRATVFAEGKRFIGMQILKMLKLNPVTIRKRNKDQPTEQG